MRVLDFEYCSEPSNVLTLPSLSCNSVPLNSCCNNSPLNVETRIYSIPRFKGALLHRALSRHFATLVQVSAKRKVRSRSSQIHGESARTSFCHRDLRAKSSLVNNYSLVSVRGPRHGSLLPSLDSLLILYIYFRDRFFRECDGNV